MLDNGCFVSNKNIPKSILSTHGPQQLFDLKKLALHFIGMCILETLFLICFLFGMRIGSSFYLGVYSRNVILFWDWEWEVSTILIRNKIVPKDPGI